MRLLRQAAALLLFISLFSSTLSAQKHRRDSLPRAVGLVNDFENILSSKQEKYLDSMIKAYEKKTTVQIAVITIDTSMISRDKFESYVYRIANAWGVGRKEKNNGVTIGLSKGYRFMRIENGYGIQNILTDNETKKIIDSAFIPYFKKGQYFEGIVNGLEAIMKKLSNL
jgi:uncharacterized protein